MIRVLEVFRSPEEIEECDGRSAIQIRVDNRIVFKVYDGDSEDANLSRDFSDCHSVYKLMKSSYDLGKEGKEVSFSSVGTDEI